MKGNIEKKKKSRSEEEGKEGGGKIGVEEVVEETGRPEEKE